MTIGSTQCDVTDATETTITCDVGPHQAGTFLVKVNVGFKGSPQYPNGRYIAEFNHIFQLINSKGLALVSVHESSIIFFR